MILLANDCLYFELPGGESIPLRAEAIVVEVAEDSAGLDPELVLAATTAVFHYFKHDEQRLCVTAGEFSAAMEKVLRRLLGTTTDGTEWAAALDGLAHETGPSELAFFIRLREELRGKLGGAPQVVRFYGLRGCVMRLAGARRWSGRCRLLRDQIVDYLRACVAAEAGGRELSLIVE